jgi:hypothetical protein
MTPNGLTGIPFSEITQEEKDAMKDKILAFDKLEFQRVPCLFGKDDVRSSTFPSTSFSTASHGQLSAFRWILSEELGAVNFVSNMIKESETILPMTPDSANFMTEKDTVRKVIEDLSWHYCRAITFVN